MTEQQKEWNPRYVAYAKAHGKTPEEMQAGQKNNVDFMIWINEKWKKYDKLHPELYGHHDYDWVHVQFDDMLSRGMI